MIESSKTTNEMVWHKCMSCYHFTLPIEQSVNQKWQHEYGWEGKGLGKRWVALARAAFLKSIMKDALTRSVLDVGSGGTTFLDCFDGAQLLVGITLDESSPTNSRAELVVCPFNEFSIRGQFDLVTAWHSLEHMNNPSLELVRMSRCCITGGYIAFEVPVDRRLRTDKYDGHVHRFTPLSVAKMLENSDRRMDWFWVGPGFCNSSVLCVGQRSSLPVKRDVDRLAKQALQGGKLSWRKAQKERLGEWL
jgi:hypothetical protein